MRILSTIFVLSLFALKISAQPISKLIDSYLSSEVQKNKWLQSDISDWYITDQYTDAVTGLTHVYIQQRHSNIIVYNAISNFLIKDGKVLYFKSGFIDHLENKINTSQSKINPESAFQFTLTHLKKGKATLRSVNKKVTNNSFIYESPEISDEEVKIQLVYRQTEKGVRLAWDVSLKIKNEAHWWNVRTDALTGEFVDKNDFTVECNFEYAESTEEISENVSFLPPPTVADYNVFAFPVEAPNFGSRTLLTDPASLSASPFGWHDIDGISGAEYTITRGNNVYAYEDANNDDLPGYSPNGGANLHFDFPFTANAIPTANQDASITNLFYDNNAIHDYLYPLGFTEAAGNFQQNNYGNGGLGNDYVRAEGFDGGGTNNANFSTPPDGLQGTMQMFLWTGNTLSCTNLNITSNTFNGSMSAVTAQFSSIGNVTANLILVNDGAGTVTDACSAITNNIAGKIALIDRGTCTFVSKAQAAQTAGAVAVIIANNTSSGAFSMTGSPTLTIPVISISQADGATLKSALLSGTVITTISTCVANQIDGSFDNGIVIHEYGHGVSNRLTGGPSQAGCLGNAEQGGEGWSDWLALMMTIRPGDQGVTARGVGTYAKGQVSTGPGIRRFPYSTNMSINPQTYGSIAANTEVHAVGEIWCDVIWDMSWLLIDQYGFNANPNIAAAGNNIAMRLVLEGMKLQPCGPGFLDARDAILTADAILYNNAHRCLIWQAFARRGMGFNASQGSANVAGDETQNFNLPPFCLPPTQVPTAAFTSDVNSVSCGGSVKFTDQSVQAFEWLWDFGDQTTSTFQNPTHTFTAPGVYNVKLTVTNPLGSDFIIHTITVNPAFNISVSAVPASICQGQQIQLNALASGSANRSYLVTNIPFAPDAGTGTLVSLTDDQVSGSNPIGFTFNFFGQNYTNFYISSNGLITFSANMPASPVYGSSIPSSADPDNFIALAWNDLNPQNAGSTISYFTTGISPNRKLVVKYNTSHYGGTSFPFVVQAIMYEGTNVVEIHTTTISDASSFDASATTTQGLENLDGSSGVPVPGRNGTIFSASNDAYRFTQYIPYSYLWNPGNLNGAAQTVVPASTGAYTVRVSDGTACLASFSTPSITVNVVDDGNACTTDACNTSNGTATHTAVSVDDGNVCTTDACNSSSGAITHSAVSVDDGIACTTDGCNSVTGVFHIPNNCGVTFHSNIFIEGYYLGGGLMSNCLNITGISPDPLASDFVTISAMNPNSPYSFVDSQVGTLKTNGDVTVVFGPAVNAGNNYYVKINHRNSIETWSAAPVQLNANANYLFSSAITQAFNSNQALTNDNTYAALFSGDINQDGAIDGTDFLDFDGPNQAGAGGYHVADLNGDGAVDGSDFLIFDPNNQNGVGSSVPIP